MFTGIIENKGQVLANKNHAGANRLVISSPFTGLQIGESIAVNGVCLTLLPYSMPGELHFDVSPETLRLTQLKHLVPGDAVNLERAMLASARLGGHYVSGHVDTIAKVYSVSPINEYLEVELIFNEEEMLYLIPKGSLTVDGVSLTINAVDHQCIKLMLVPHTLSHTTLGALQKEQQVNIEFDYLTRIIAHQVRVLGKLNNEVAS